ncbi:hypothetical protein Afil01_54830 [Actinorhabdospora filicis]|uniref:Uncharacterized protein n=1 Tax=Actinorhabdospora filicis TaxID=1785913 RepID=A0A9W6WCK3_9ACTN|nr:hypothetical protein [Actinorhabdospora filicis]GLZ80676.1 hypothetical protein Afil01_54830 [Actinorhabdospora filicis]
MAGPLRPGPWWRPAADSPLRALEGRLLTHVRARDTRRIEALAPHLGPNGGLVLTGSGGARTQHLLRDPAGYERQAATWRTPFTHGDGLHPVPLDDLLDGQREAGAAVAVTPTLLIRAGDAGSLVAVLRATARCRREDVLCLLPLAPGWLRPPFDALLRQALHDFPIPIALVTRAGPAVLRDLVERFPGLCLMRTDLSAFDAMARGSPFASVEARGGVWIDDLLARRDGRDLALMFADTAAPACHCATCRGRRLDRFVTDESRSEADAHMLEGLSTLHAQLRYVDAPRRPDWWRNRCHDAVLGYSRWFRRWRSTAALSASTALRFWADS